MFIKPVISQVGGGIQVKVNVLVGKGSFMYI
jgi:hypothetical protein